MTEQEYIGKRNALFHTIVGSAFESYNYFHTGVDELTYEAGLKVELEYRGKVVHRQAGFPIYYKGVASGVDRRMDLVVQDNELGFVVIELKAIERVGDVNRHQLWSYMKLMNIHLGMLVNFSPKGVYYEAYELNEETGKCDYIKFS